MRAAVGGLGGVLGTLELSATFLYMCFGFPATLLFAHGVPFVNSFLNLFHSLIFWYIFSVISLFIREYINVFCIFFFPLEPFLLS